jgi:hypothetical protein
MTYNKVGICCVLCGFYERKNKKCFLYRKCGILSKSKMQRHVTFQPWPIATDPRKLLYSPYNHQMQQLSWEYFIELNTGLWPVEMLYWFMYSIPCTVGTFAYTYDFNIIFKDFGQLSCYSIDINNYTPQSFTIIRHIRICMFKTSYAKPWLVVNLQKRIDRVPECVVTLLQWYGSKYLGSGRVCVFVT